MTFSVSVNEFLIVISYRFPPKKGKFPFVVCFLECDFSVLIWQRANLVHGHSGLQAQLAQLAPSGASSAPDALKVGLAAATRDAAGRLPLKDAALANSP